MKFSSTLQFNAVPEWRDHYLDYDQLKKLIFRLERANVYTSQEEESLIGQDPTEVMDEAIQKEIQKVDEFYEELENKARAEFRALEAKLRAYFGSVKYSDLPSTNGTASAHHHDGEHSQRHRDSAIADEEQGDNNAGDRDVASDSSDDEDTDQPRRRSTIHDEVTQKRSIPFENVNLRREITRHYVFLNELLSYSDLNREGIRKALKKFDKVHNTSMLQPSLAKLSGFRVFSDESNHEVASMIDTCITNFAKLTGETEEKSADTLSGLLREHVVYERNTVWRELIGLERQAQGVQPGAEPIHSGKSKRKGISKLLSPKVLKLMIAFLMFLVILMIKPLESGAQSRCLAIVVLASILWATESLPLFVTSLMVPFLVVLFRIPLDQEGNQLPAKEASAFVFSKMWSPVISVLLGGFTLAAALSKYNIAKALAQATLSKIGTENPRGIILVFMFVGAFLCMWISNVAAPVLLFSVAQPLLRIVPPGDPFCKSLIMGIALACNVGGIASPISSPQNIIALQNMYPVPSWLEWFCVSIPVAISSILLVWLWICVTLRVTDDAKHAMTHINSAGSSHVAEFKFVHYFVLGVTFLTIALWCFSHQLENAIGDMGILALVPIVLLFGSGVLTAADFNNFLWTIVALAMGGIVLGGSVESCGLLISVASAIKDRVSHLPLFIICITFGLMILVVASFISHTVAALIILPLVKSIGEQLDDPHPRLIVMIAAILCSGAMALPTSGFPNVTAVCLVDEFGKPYLSVNDFLTRGIPASFIVFAVAVTLGFLLCSMLGF